VTDRFRAAADGTEPAADQFDFRALTFSASGSHAFILTGKYTAGFGSFDYRLYHGTVANILGASDDLINGASGITNINNANVGGFLFSLLYSESEVATWFVKNNDLSLWTSSPTPLVATAGGIAALSTFPTGQFPSLNFVSIYEGEVAPAPRAFKAYLAPAFISGSPAFVAERKRLIDLMQKNQKK
jgi:hypothetical protein